MNLEAITHLWNYRPRKFRSDAFLFWSRGPDSYRKNDRKRAVVWPWLVLQLSTVLALTQLGIRQSDWRRAGIRSTNLHIVVELTTRNKFQWNLNRNSNIFIQENGLEKIICKMLAILSRPQCFNIGMGHECHEMSNKHLCTTIFIVIAAHTFWCTVLLPQVSSLYTCLVSLHVVHSQSGPRLNIKTVLSTYGDFHVKDKTAVRTSYL